MLSIAWRRARGVTLVELLVGMSIVAVLLGLGLPSISLYLQSSKLASAANAYLSGVQMARTEAIRRNTQVQFVLTDTDVSTADLANVVVPSVNGRSWVVRAVDPTILPPAPPQYQLVEAKAAVEGAFSVTAAPSVQIVGNSTPTVFAGIVPFNGFGATSDQSSYTFDLQNTAGGTCAIVGGPMHCPRIEIPSGGLVHLCDPSVTLASDTRSC